jgi:hypothetical protein
MGEPTELMAVFTGDSTNYHIFQIVDNDDFVGSLYIKKKSTNGVPEGADISFITPSRDKHLWKKGLKSLIEKARDGSKAKQKLERTMKNYS